MSRLSTNHISVNNILDKNYLPVADVFNFGVAGGDDYGTTNNTNFYNGVVIPVGGYVIYLYQNSLITANAPKDDAECLYYLNRYGAGASNITDALSWAAVQPNITVQSSEYVINDLLYTFTIESSMLNGLANFGDSNYASANGTAGFTVAQQIDNLWFGVYGNLNTYSDIEIAFNSVGAASNFNGYIFDVKWGAGSTYSNGIAKVSYNSGNHQFTVTSVDSSNSTYQQSGTNNGYNLVGTFNFPATFTFVRPLITKQDWC
jgi:hypothetical protein